MPDLRQLKKYRLLPIIALMFYGCGLPADLNGYNDVTWKSDANGCNGDRLAMTEVFVTQKDKIKGLDEPQILRLLGKPDKQELYIRSQKFFVYYMEPGPTCENSIEPPLLLTIRFNALGYTNEVFLENFTK